MKYILSGLIIILCLAGAIYVGNLRSQVDKKTTQHNEPSFIVSAGVPLGGGFELTSHLGKKVKDEDFRGKLMLLYFGYTFCPDLCPSELTGITKALNLLGEKVKEVQPIFITIDPQRDTQEVLKNYVELFHPQFLGLYGNESELKTVTENYKVYAAKTEDKGGDNYLMDHSTFTYLIGRDGKIISMFRLGTPSSVMAEEIKKHY